MNRSCFVIMKKAAFVIVYKKYMLLAVEVLHYEKASIKFSKKRRQ